MATNNVINAPIPFSLANGGTGASLTAVQGGIAYSGASTMAFSAAGTAGQIFQSAGTGTPVWTTATYPSTTTINRLLYSSANDVVGQVTAANDAVLTSTHTGVPTWLTLTDGQLIIGATGAAPAAANLTAGTNISITNSANGISIAATGSGSFSWVDQTSSTVTMAVNTGYYTDNGATPVTYTLPAAFVKGSVFEIAGFSSGGWSLAQNASQLVHFGNVTTTTGVGGSMSSTNPFDCIRLLAVVANTTLVVLSAVGNLTYV